MILREFNDAGLSDAHTVLDALAAGGDSSLIKDILAEENYSDEMGLKLPRRPPDLPSRFELAIWLNNNLEPVLKSGDTDMVGMWTWLTFYMFDILAPPRADGTRKLGERALYVLEPDNWRRYYRHLLAGPCRVMRAHWDELDVTRAILAGKPNVPGEVYAQIASRAEIITSPSLVRLTKRLYWENETKSLARGAGGKGLGASRRLANILQQLDLTWDFADMDDESLVRLLPKREFSRFLK